MRRTKAKQKVVAAIRTIVQAAKELTEAEAEYRKSNSQTKERKLK